MNKLSQQELWEKIKSFQLDEPGSSFPFSKKLAQQNGWSASFTQQAIEEYKKFILLCCIVPGGASPSAIVDEVWHLHLTYTDNYWNKFCRDTLNQQIHHHPSKGGAAEKHKHEEWYAATLIAYETLFDSSPPAAYWPPVQAKTPTPFLDVYHPRVLKQTLLVYAFALVLYIAIVDLFHTSGPEFLVHFALLAAGSLATLYYLQRHKKERLYEFIDSNTPVNYSSFQITRFLYGAHRAYQTALIDALKRNIVELEGQNYRIEQLPTALNSENNPLVLALQANYTAGDYFTYDGGFVLAEKWHVFHPQLEQLHQLSTKADYKKLIIPCMLLFVAAARCLQGIANGKPIELLVFSTIVFGFFTLVMLHSFSYTILVRARMKDYWLLQNADGYGADIINNFSIHGTTAIEGFAEFAVLSAVFNAVTPTERKWNSGDSAGCSSGDGGGGDGGGCGGGCGGCGGGD